MLLCRTIKCYLRKKKGHKFNNNNNLLDFDISLQQKIELHGLFNSSQLDGA